MSSHTQIVVLVEGKTEQIFIQNILYPYLFNDCVLITPIIISKPGQKGGDVKFSRVINDIRNHLKQRSDTFLTLFVDFYAIGKDWPGLDDARKQKVPGNKAEVLNQATKKHVDEMFNDHGSFRRFVPYVAMHEFEAMLFSDPHILSEHLGVSEQDIEKIISECGEPENIDDSPHSAPSKRLEKLSMRFKKTTTGITVAKAIGIEKIRSKCPIFDGWLAEVESL